MLSLKDFLTESKQPITFIGYFDEELNTFVIDKIKENGHAITDGTFDKLQKIVKNNDIIKLKDPDTGIVLDVEL